MVLRGIISGSGRCGTHSVTAFLDGRTFRTGDMVVARHESDFARFERAATCGDVDTIIRALRSYQHHLEVDPLFSALPQRILPELPLIAIIRDGRDTVTTGYNVGWFEYSDNTGPVWMDVHPFFQGDRFAYCCQYWTWTNLNLRAYGALFFRLEELIIREDVRLALLDALHIIPTAAELPHKNRSETGQKGWIVGKEGILRQSICSHWTEWTPEQWATFDRYCGRAMDVFYPGWRADVTERAGQPSVGR